MRRTLVFALLVCLLPCLAAAEVRDRIVAQVNGEIITLYDLNRQLAPMLERFNPSHGQVEDEKIGALRRQLLDRLIDDILLEQEAARLTLTVTELELENQMRKIRTENRLSEEEFERQLSLQGMSLDDYRKKLRKDILKYRLIGAMVRRKVVVTKEDIQKYYDAHMGEYGVEQDVHLGLIILRPGSSAEELRQRIVSGELSFADAAKAASIGPGASAGGDIGRLKWDEIAPDWKKALRDLKPGEISQPISVNETYEALLLLQSRGEGERKPLSEVEDQIRDILLEPKYEQQFAEYMHRLRAKAIIENKL